MNDPNSVQGKLAELKLRLNRSPTVMAEMLNHPSGYEAGIRHPITGGFMLLRDDGVAEVNGGKSATVQVDGPAGQVSVRADQIALMAGQNLHLHAPYGGLWFGYQQFNPWWQSEMFDPTWAWLKAPVHQLYPGALGTHQFVAGVPDLSKGQYNVNLSTLFGAMPLLGPNLMPVLLGKKLAEIMKSVVLSV